MTLIDLEATKKGKTIKSVMTPEEARECCASGYLGLNIPTRTPDGRKRDVSGVTEMDNRMATMYGMLASVVGE